MAEVSVFEKDGHRDLFPPQLLEIIGKLHEEFGSIRSECLEARVSRQAEYDSGNLPTFVASHPAHEGDWKVAAIPTDCLDRRVEITGPVNSSKMVINMLSRTETGARADMAMLDFEDSMCPTWTNVIDGYRNVIGAAKRDLKHQQKSKTYALDPDDMAHMMVRVRGLHMQEDQIQIDGRPASASLVDLAVCSFHTCSIQMELQQTPIFYVPKIEHYEEARWWNAVIAQLESYLQLPQGSIRVTALIETLPATFQIEEILYELRERILGLNGGRWDKIFSDIKVLRNHPDRILDDRAEIHMLRTWMDNYQKRIIKICHSRGAFALGGMSAFTPGKDPEVRQRQTEKVMQDKKREADMGCDGCWVSHPYFIGIAREQFAQKNQLQVTLPDFPMQPSLLPEPSGKRTLSGLRTNLRVGIAYMAGWNQGIGCVAFDGLMEDLATLEISRAQVWQWKTHRASLDSGEVVDENLLRRLFDEELDKIIREFNLSGELAAQYTEAKKDAEALFLQDELSDFLTVTDMQKVRSSISN